MESKLIRDILAPLEAVVDVKISLTDRRVNVEHKDELAPETIVDMLNDKFLGASLQDRSVVETVGGSFNHIEMARLTVNCTQLLLLVATLAVNWIGHHHRLANGMGLTCVALSVSLFHEAYLALRRRSPNVELMMALAMAGALAQGEIVEAATVGALVTLMDLVKVFALEAVGRQLRGSVVTEPMSVDIPEGGRVLLSELAVGDVGLGLGLGSASSNPSPNPNLGPNRETKLLPRWVTYTSCAWVTSCLRMAPSSTAPRLSTRAASRARPCRRPATCHTHARAHAHATCHMPHATSTSTCACTCCTCTCGCSLHCLWLQVQGLGTALRILYAPDRQAESHI